MKATQYYEVCWACDGKGFDPLIEWPCYCDVCGGNGRGKMRRTLRLQQTINKEESKDER